MQTPVLATMGQIHDEGLFVREAASLLQGDWFGQDLAKAMAKAPGFAYYLALCKLSGFSYQLCIAALFVVAAAVTARALRPVVPSPWVRLGVYILVLWGPILFLGSPFMRVYRNLLNAALVVIFFACYIAIWLRRARGERWGPWLVGPCLALPLFRIANETWFWVLPFCAVASIAIALVRPRSLRTVGRLALPFAACLVVVGVTVLGNGLHYGVWATNIRFEGAFSKAMDDLVDLGGVSDYEPYESECPFVTRAELRRAAEVSPTLRSLQERALKWFDLWASGQVSVADEIAGDRFSWALIDAYFDEFPDHDLASFEAFWSSVHDELGAAYARGDLQREPGLSLADFTPAIGAEDVGPWLANVLVSLGRMVSGELIGDSYVYLDDIDFRLYAGSPAAQQMAQSLYGGPTIMWSDQDGVGPSVRPSSLVLAGNRLASRLWAGALPVLGVITLAAIVAGTVSLAKGGRRARAMALPVLGVALSILALALAVSWFYGWHHTANGDLNVLGYLLPAFSLYVMLMAMVLGCGIQSILERRRPGRTKLHTHPPAQRQARFAP